MEFSVQDLYKFQTIEKVKVEKIKLYFAQIYFDRGKIIPCSLDFIQYLLIVSVVRRQW